MITAAQCRAARGLLQWRQKDLAEKSGLSALAIRNFETGKTSPHHATLTLLRQTFEAHGVAFLDENGGGLKLKG